MLRRFLLLALAVLLLLPACGSSEDAGSLLDPDERTSPTSDASGADDPDAAAERDDTGDGDGGYADVFAESLMGADGGGFSFTRREAECATERVLDEIGIERLQEAGLTEQALKLGSRLGSDLTDEEARVIVDALFDCGDVGDAIAQEITAGLDAGGGMFTEEHATCAADAIANDDAVRDLIAHSLQAGDFDEIPHDTAAHLVDLMLDCLQIADVLIETLADAGVPLTLEQQQCLRDEFDNNEAFREAMIASINGEQMSSFDSQQIFLDIATACGLDTGTTTF